MDQGHIIYVAAECSYRIVQNYLYRIVQNVAKELFLSIDINKDVLGCGYTLTREKE